MYPRTFYSPPGSLVVYNLFFFGARDANTQPAFSHWARAASDMGEYLVALHPPWMKPKTIMALSEWTMHHRMYTEAETPEIGLNREALFGCFSMLALMVETTLRAGPPKNPSLLLKLLRHPNLRCFSPLLEARLEKHATEAIQNRLDSLQFTAAQQAFAWSWIRAQMDLLSPAPTEDLTSPRVPD
jgi:hypothetical protein